VKSESKRELSRFLKLKYPVELAEQEGGWYFARIPDLPGCMSEGKTPGEAVKNIEAARALWLEDALDSGVEIPLPSEQRKYSGKFVVRLPESLHGRLAQGAERDGVSLNQYVLALLAENNALRAVEAKVEKVCAAVEGFGTGVAGMMWSFKGLQMKYGGVSAGDDQYLAAEGTGSYDAVLRG
jgi:predicted RNase H-like HicB family nuclease